MTKPTIMLIPGNGGSHIDTDHWYSWVRNELRELGYKVTAHDMPDPIVAHAGIWLPHMEAELYRDPNCIIIGHSSGGVAALRYLESHRLIGAIVVGVNHTDLDDETERESGYYSSPWQWSKIKVNAGWIVQFASTDDPYIPISEPRFIHEQLHTEYHELHDRGHFMVDNNPINNTFPEIVDIINSKISTT